MKRYKFEKIIYLIPRDKNLLTKVIFREAQAFGKQLKYQHKLTDECIEDIIQELLLKYEEAFYKHNPARSSFKTFIFSVWRHKISDIFRSKRIKVRCGMLYEQVDDYINSNHIDIDTIKVDKGDNND